LPGEKKMDRKVVKPDFITWSEWEHYYKPIRNPLDPDAPLDGAMFETYGEELNFVTDAHRKEPGSVWTYVDDDNGALILSSGFSYVNRIGYAITETHHSGSVIVIDTLPADDFDDEEE
jgi:hypothetical protein